MKKPALFIVIALALAVVWFMFRPGSAPQTPDYKTLSYTIEGQRVDLVNGHTQTEATPGSASLITTQYFGNEAVGDIDGDGIPDDVAFLLTQNSGGSGTFYYVVAALKDAQGNYKGTNAILLGDRIAPQTTQIEDGAIVVNYADRAAGEPMTTPPSVGKTRLFVVSHEGVLSEIPPLSGLGARCGGNITTAQACGKGLHCAPQPGSHLPFGDVGGVCVAD